MDTRSKKRKTIISFAVFFLSISLMLVNMASILRQVLSVENWKEYGFSQLFEQDYQNTRQFRSYIQGRLSDFIAMASEGEIGTYFDVESPYWGSTTASSYTWKEDLSDTGIKETERTVTETVDSGTSQESSEAEHGSWQETADGATDDQKSKAEYAAEAKAYHESIRENKNLLYRIYNRDRPFYTNMEDISFKVSDEKLPEGYNFLMVFDGEKVTIKKDGKELDVYGDGYYRGGKQWYVPGYKNFTLDKEAEKIQIVMLAAQEPVHYSSVKYGQGGYRQTDNRLYNLAQFVRQSYKQMRFGMIGLAAGILLFAVSFLLRKEKKAADAAIARFMGKIWFEGKLVILLLLAVTLHGLFEQAGYAQVTYGDASVTYFLSDVSQVSDVAEIAGVSTGTAVWKFSLEYLYACLKSAVSNPFYLWVCFWLIYLLLNDIVKNRGHFWDGIIRRFVRQARTNGLKQPFAVQQMRSFVFMAVLCLMFAAAVLVIAGFLYRFSSFTELIFTLSVLMILFLMIFLQCLTRTKRQAKELDLLADYIQAVQGGDYSDRKMKVSEDSSLRQLFDSISQIRQGMERAVGEQLKSERMKVELVANVSHDLKTPLTSIISYLAFLKQEEGLPEHVKDYIRILDEKAQRLNTIVQDVFAVSKAASGQLPVELKELDFGKLLRQTLADMEEQIIDSPVTIKTEIPAERVLILADGNRLYRVFQNLIQNALKYSLEGSRIFIDLRIEGKNAAASVKNISRQELGMGADFTERFVRGDKSRTDGGAGLGLSIAKSFTEACGGEFILETNADLFVVRVIFECRS